VEDVVAGELALAMDTVQVAIYTFTNTEIHDALFDAAAVRGVQVQVCADAGQSYTLSDQYDLLRSLRDDAGIPVRVANGAGGGIMHHKYTVIDGRTVLTGSFNYTRSANETNDENLVVLTSPQLASDFQAAYQELWSRCEELE